MGCQNGDVKAEDSQWEWTENEEKGGGTQAIMTHINLKMEAARSPKMVVTTNTRQCHNP
jgi:hypothetical protein